MDQREKGGEEIYLGAERLRQYIVLILFFHAFYENSTLTQGLEFLIILFQHHQSHGKKIPEWKATGAFFFYSPADKIEHFHATKRERKKR